MIKWSKLTKTQWVKVKQGFCYDFTATQTSKFSGLNRNTINNYFRLFREKIARHQESISNGFRGQVELDESYFGGGHKGRRGRGTAKIPVFGIKKRNGRVYTQIIKNATGAEIRPIIKEFVRKGSTVYTDGWRAYDGLVLSGYKHHRVNHSIFEYSDRKGNHINGIENFWSFAKRRLLKFNGVPAKQFYLFLKECEWRYNEKPNLYEKLSLILKIF